MSIYEKMLILELEHIKNYYDISNNGFLPAEPITCLKDGPFVEWEKVMTILPELNKNKLVRSTILKLPQFSWQDLKEPWQIKRAYVVLSLLTNSYVHSETLPDKIPSILAIPLWNVSELLGINPILTHAAVDLYNWDLKDKNKNFELDNLKSNNLLTGSPDEEWFYLVMVAIEQIGGRIINSLINILVDQLNNKIDKNNLVKNLGFIVQDLNSINKILVRMNEKCNPDIFYNQLRPYLGGWETKGMIYEGVSEEPQKYVGGSAAQSSLFQAIDCAFSIDHKDEYFNKIKDYMPDKHRKFINFIKSNLHIDLIVKNLNDIRCNFLFNTSVKLLERFRMLHYGLVYKYIIKMDKTSLDEIKGTGGTNLTTFLKQSIKETTTN